MKEFGDALYLRTCDDLLTLEMIETAAPAVEAMFLAARNRHQELQRATYRFVAGKPVEAGKYWFHPFGWYALIDGDGGGSDG